MTREELEKRVADSLEPLYEESNKEPGFVYLTIAMGRKPSEDRELLTVSNLTADFEGDYNHLMLLKCGLVDALDKFLKNPERLRPEMRDWCQRLADILDAANMDVEAATANGPKPKSKPAPEETTH